MDRKKVAQKNQPSLTFSMDKHLKDSNSNCKNQGLKKNSSEENCQPGQCWCWIWCKIFLRKICYTLTFARFACTKMFLKFKIRIVLMCNPDFSKVRSTGDKQKIPALQVQGTSSWSKVFSINKNYMTYI